MIGGIDFSTKAIDVVLLDEDTSAPEWHRYSIDVFAGDAFDRTRRIREVMPPRGWWKDNGVIAVGLEQPRGKYGVTPLFRVQGAILACLPVSLLVQPWNPAEWRHAVGLKGNATKQQVAEHVAPWARAEWPQDAFDALAIAQATQSVVERDDVDLAWEPP